MHILYGVHYLFEALFTHKPHVVLFILVSTHCFRDKRSIFGFILFYNLLQRCDEENLRCRLGFFLHIPFPAWDLMRLFPWDDQILQGMLGMVLTYLAL